MIGACCVMLWQFVGKNIGGVHENPASYSDVLNSAQNGKVKNVTIDGTTLTGQYTNSDSFRTIIPANDPEMYDILRAHGVNVSNKDENSNFWLSMLVSIVPFVLLLGFWGVLLFIILRAVRLKCAAPPKST